MNSPTYRARITEPLPYVGDGGKPAKVPLGPCLVERRDRHLAEVTWGLNRQNTVVVPVLTLAAAASRGHLVLLD